MSVAQERLQDHRKEAEARAALSEEREALRGPLAAQIQVRLRHRSQFRHRGSSAFPDALHAMHYFWSRQAC